MTQHNGSLTNAQARLLDAIGRTPNPTYRALAQAARISSTSEVRRYLMQLAERGEIVLDERDGRLFVETGADYCAGWDAAARLAGNPEA